MIVKGDDLVAGTHGRGFWILDDITPLRQIERGAARRPLVCSSRRRRYRVRWNTNTDTPMPPDEAGGQNPPDGAIINYYAGVAAAGPVTLEILDAAGKSVRRYSSSDRGEIPTRCDRAGANVLVPPAADAVERGRDAPLPVGHSLSADSGWRRRARRPADRRGAARHRAGAIRSWAPPGQYTVKLTVDGKSYTQPLTLKMDPRVTTPALGLAQQFTLSKQLYDGIIDGAEGAGRGSRGARGRRRDAGGSLAERCRRSKARPAAAAPPPTVPTRSTA